MSGVKVDRIVSKIYEMKFMKLDNEYYYKRKISFLKDYINYYVKIVQTQDFNKTMKKEIDGFLSFNGKRKNKCFILYIVKDSVKDEDIKSLIDASSISILNDEVLFTSIRYDSIVITLLDKSTDLLYFVPYSEFGVMIYKYGIKFITKCL